MRFFSNFLYSWKKGKIIIITYNDNKFTDRKEIYFIIPLNIDLKK